MVRGVRAVLSLTTLVAALAASGCSYSYCRTATCSARQLVDELTAEQAPVNDRRAVFTSLRQRMQLSDCPSERAPVGVLCASRSGATRSVELRAALDPADPRESRYVLNLASAGAVEPLQIPDLGEPYGMTLAEEPGWLLAGGVLMIRPVAQTLGWISPQLVGDPLDRLEAAGQPTMPRFGDLRILLEVQSRWRSDQEPLRREYQFSPRADDSPRETTRIVLELRGRAGEPPGDDATIDAIEIAAVRDREKLDPKWLAAWVRDLRLQHAAPAIATAGAQAPVPGCVRAAKRGNFAVTWTVHRQGPLYLHTIRVMRRLVALERFAAAPYLLCDEARGVFSR